MTSTYYIDLEHFIDTFSTRFEVLGESIQRCETSLPAIFVFCFFVFFPSQQVSGLVLLRMYLGWGG